MLSWTDDACEHRAASVTKMGCWRIDGSAVRAMIDDDSDVLRLARLSSATQGQAKKSYPYVWPEATGSESQPTIQSWKSHTILLSTTYNERSPIHHLAAPVGLHCWFQYISNAFWGEIFPDMIPLSRNRFNCGSLWQGQLASLQK